MGSTTDYLDEVSKTLETTNAEGIDHAVSILRRAKEHNHVFIVGNGGSAATASHLANDLVKMANIDARALTDAAPTILAYGNDNGWEQMFSDVLKTIFRANDVLIAISCSGRSKNVIEAAKVAEDLHGYLIVMTGPKAASPLATMLPHALISIESSDIRMVEDCHLAVCHAIAGALKEEA